MYHINIFCFIKSYPYLVKVVLLATKKNKISAQSATNLSEKQIFINYIWGSHVLATRPLDFQTK